MQSHTWLSRRLPLAMALLLVLALVSSAQLTEQQQADMVLASARKAHNEKNYTFAATRFREFLQKFGGHKEADNARYGLALCLVEGADKNWTEARDLLAHLAGKKEFPDRPTATYFLAYALRGLGLNELNLAQAKPQEAGPRQAEAQKRFTEAAAQFQAAADLFHQRVKDIPPDKLPADLEWAARALCDQAEMYLRTFKVKEARDVTSLFIKKNEPLTRSKYRDLGRYYHGFASFLLQDYKTAEITLSQLTPFSDPLFGTHARYLLARTHHLAGERSEAGLHYDGVLKDYAAQRQEAINALKKPEVQRDPVEKARLEAFVKEAPPDHVGRAAFYQGVLLYEAGRFAEAKSRFIEVIKQFPKTPVMLEAELRLGYCQVQLKEYAEAIKTLQALMPKDARLADQAQYWLGRARIGAAPDPVTNFPQYKEAVLEGVNQMTQAAEKARLLMSTDPEAKERRGEMLLESGDVLHQLKQYKDAIGRYQLVLQEKLLPQRHEEILQRILTAQHLDGAYDASDRTCQDFFNSYPKSPLIPAVLFRYAENAYFRALEHAKNPNQLNFAAELGKRQDEAIRRYEELVKKYPEFPQINLARHGLGLAWYRKGDLEKARLALEAIPEDQRSGELAVVNYILADCLMRQLPTVVPDDALEAGKMEEKVKAAIKLLDSFTSSTPQGPQTAAALLKLGLCYQKLAALLAQPPEKKAALDSARAAYDKLVQPAWAKHPAQPQAFLEKAKCFAQANDFNNALKELSRFHQEPLKSSSVAPMALLQLAIIQRTINKIDDAVNTLAQARDQYEASLKADATRAEWVVQLRYHHGVALREAKKFNEARALFEMVMKETPARVEAAESALRVAQCLREEGMARLEAARKLLAAAKKPEETTAARKQEEEGLGRLRDSVKFLDGQIDALRQKKQYPEIQARMLYESAWCLRELARGEIEQAREKIQQERMKNLPDKAKLFPPPPVALREVPIQPAEQRARAQYQALTANHEDQPLALEANFELAEMLSDRGEHDEAIQRLRAALEAEPGPDLRDKIRIRLGAAHAEKGDLKTALSHLEAVTRSKNIALAAQAFYRAGEVLLAQKDYAEAVKRLTVFRDDPKFHNIAGVSDRALLRLGHALAHLKDWNASKQAHETLVGRFPQSEWLPEARYGIGWAWQQLKQYDQAVAAYAQVTGTTANETAARAQLQIGLCRLEQKRYADACTALLVVPHTFDYPELSAVALLEASRAFAEQKQPRQAIPLLRRVLRDHPNTRWAEAARDRLEALEK